MKKKKNLLLEILTLSSTKEGGTCKECDLLLQIVFSMEDSQTESDGGKRCKT